MAISFSNSRTLIESYIAKEKQINTAIASTLADSVLTRMSEGTISRKTEIDIRNNLRDVSDPVDVLIQAIVLVAMNTKPVTKNNNSNFDDMPTRYNNDSKKKIRNRADLFGGNDDD